MTSGLVHRIDRAQGGSDAARAAKFWSGALGYAAKPGQPEFLAPSGWSPPSTTGQDHGAAHLHLDETDGVHVDLWVNDGDTVESEVDRLLGLGAKRVDWEVRRRLDARGPRPIRTATSSASAHRGPPARSTEISRAGEAEARMGSC